MVDNVLLCLEALPTNVTLELPLPGVPEDVVLEAALGAKLHAALGTLVVLLAGVRNAVSLQGALL